MSKPEDPEQVEDIEELEDLEQRPLAAHGLKMRALEETSLRARGPTDPPEHVVLDIDPAPDPDESDERQCRICFEGDDDDDQKDEQNPLISPCRCTGGSRFVHRKCLEKWRTTNHRADASYKCEVCKFQYQYRRMFWASFFGNRFTVAAVFLVLLAASCYICGYIPILSGPLQVSEAVKASLWMHFANGVVVVGILGLVVTIVECVRGRIHSGMTPDACSSVPCIYCIPDIACAEGMCFLMLGVLLVFGFFMASYFAYSWIWRCVKSLMKKAEHMVENVS